LNALGVELLKKIEDARAHSKLSDAPFYVSIARAWAYIDKPEAPKAWLSEGMLKDAQFLAKAAWGLVSYSMMRRERTYHVRERPDDSLYDIQVLHDACKKHLAGTELNSDERNRVAAVLEAVDRILSKSDD
jgi:hypothetical protein